MVSELGRGTWTHRPAFPAARRANARGPLCAQTAPATLVYGTTQEPDTLNPQITVENSSFVGRDTFRALFGAPVGAESDQRAAYDFAAVDRLLPYPVYAPQSWVCVLNPSLGTFEAVKPLLADAYDRVATRHARRQATPD